MKTLKYILSVIAILSVVSVSAATFGTPYRPQQRKVSYSTVQVGMPQATMSSTSTMMYSGSSLPLAAATGVTTSYDTNPSKAPGRPRRVGENDGFEEDEEDPDVPVNPFPVGDAVLPMMLLVAAYGAFLALRRRKQKKEISELAN